MQVTQNQHAVELLLNNANNTNQHNRRNQTSMRTNALNIFTDNRAKSIYCNLNAVFCLGFLTDGNKRN